MRSAIATLTVILLLHAGIAVPAEPFFSDHERGWFWHEDPPPQTKQKKDAPKRKAASRPSQTTDDPRQRLARFREQLEIARARAILNPTDENVLAWMEMNHQMLEMGTKFAYAFRRVLLQHPALDATLERPVATRAVHAWYDARRQLIDERLRQAAESYGLFFFYKGSCPFCHRFAPILKRFVKRYGFHVIAVTLDGRTLPEFPDSRFDPGAAMRFRVDRVPMLLLAQPKRRRLQIVSAGYIGMSELEQRIYELVYGAPPNPSTQSMQTAVPTAMEASQ